MTQTTQTAETTAPIEIDDLLAALVAQVEWENAQPVELPDPERVTAFPSPFAD